MMAMTAPELETSPSSEELMEAIGSFRRVLEQEKQALLALDHVQLHLHTKAKERWAWKVSELAGRVGWTDEIRREMHTLVELAEENRVLISCAKNCVSACMDMVAGPPATYGTKKSAPRSVLVQTRG